MRRKQPFALVTVASFTSLGLLLATPLWAWDGVVEKQTFEMESFTTQGGETIPNVTIGWEAYGELNEARDNAILITHFFSGTSHAAGRYGADGEPPTEGLKEALKLVTLNANHWQWANEAFNRDWADDARDPSQDITARYAIEQTLDDIAAARAALSDANHLLYLVRANQTFMAGYGDSLEAGLAAIEAPTLMLYSENDLVFAPEGVRRTAELIEADGTEVALETLEGNRGHLDGVVAIEQASDTLRAFLE